MKPGYFGVKFGRTFTQSISLAPLRCNGWLLAVQRLSSLHRLTSGQVSLSCAHASLGSVATAAAVALSLQPVQLLRLPFPGEKQHILERHMQICTQCLALALFSTLPGGLTTVTLCRRRDTMVAVSFRKPSLQTRSLSMTLLCYVAHQPASVRLFNKCLMLQEFSCRCSQIRRSQATRCFPRPPSASIRRRLSSIRRRCTRIATAVQPMISIHSWQLTGTVAQQVKNPQHTITRHYSHISYTRFRPDL